MALMNRIIETFSNPGDLVMDPFCGSGSFLDAANKLGRNCIGFDISDRAIAIAKKRLGINV
jgi:DNA modification methylase